MRARAPETRLPACRLREQSDDVPENYFDAWVAQRYENLWPHLFDPQVVGPVVSFLAHLAGDGRALELGIGTGRLALPLSRRGVRVDGIELSAAMVEQLHSQPGSADIDVTIGDFSTARVNGTFTLAYLVRNTIMNLTTQDAQVECFRNVWPSELDLMARLAGMALRDRWSDWNREPFTSTSSSHISVWQKPD